MWDRIKNWYSRQDRLDKIMLSGMLCVGLMLPVIIFSRLGSYFDNLTLVGIALGFLVLQLTVLVYQITQVVLGKIKGDL